MFLQEAAKGPLRWSSSQAASYIIKKRMKKKKHPVIKPKNKIHFNLSERI